MFSWPATNPTRIHGFSVQMMQGCWSATRTTKGVAFLWLGAFKKALLCEGKLETVALLGDLGDSKISGRQRHISRKPSAQRDWILKKSNRSDWLALTMVNHGELIPQSDIQWTKRRLLGESCPQVPRNEFELWIDSRVHSVLVMVMLA